MSIREDEYLPTEEELTVQEIDVSGPILKAAAVYIGKECIYQNNEFMLCRRETNDPRPCINEGKEVTKCSLNILKKIHRHCDEEFRQYVNCLDKSSPDQNVTFCRNTQNIFDRCMKDKLDMDRPPYDYFARVHIHETKRPKPEEEKIEYPDPTPYLPPDTPKPNAKYGSRYLWMW